MKRLLFTGIAILVLVSLLAPKSRAIKPFLVEFQTKYLEESENEEFVKTAKEAKCHLCHIGKKKKNRNAYGQELEKLLDKKTDKKDKEKIRKALDTVAALPADAKKKKGPKFGDLIAKGKLPGGKVQKEDPEGEEEGEKEAAGS